MSQFVKSLYIHNPNEEYIDKAVIAGINTLFFSIPVEDSLLHKYVNMGLYVIPVVTYIQLYHKLPEDEQFFDGSMYYQWLPCPTSKDTVRKLLEYPLELHYKGICNAICIDFSNSNGYIEDWEYYKCQCRRCKSLSTHEQRTNNINIISDKIEDLSLYSITSPNPYILSKSDWWMNTNYNIHETLKNMKTLGITFYKSSKAETLLDVKKNLSNPNIDGYWLHTLPEIPNDEYFARLKILNEDITRKSKWFKLKNFLTRI